MKSISTAIIACTIAYVVLSPAALASTERVLYSFSSGTDGANPAADLINVRGKLYGTTYNGGIGDCTGGCGTVFSLDRKTGAEAVLHSFGSEAGDLDGLYPQSGLIYLKGILYGTAELGGPYQGGNGGTLFSLNPTTGVETVLWSFGNGTDGFNPSGSLVRIKDTLYGTAESGGRFGASGAVFSLNWKTDAEKVHHSFGGGTDGAIPVAGLIDVDGPLYGTTAYGGTYGDGTVFSLNRKSGSEKVLWSFGSGTDGQHAFEGLINVGGTLYGTTTVGGTYGNGTVFSFNPTTGAETVLYSFGSGTDGQHPSSDMINVGSTLYGVTQQGGAYGYGTVFSLNPTTGAETVLWSFGNGTDGRNPYAGMIDVNGRLYGTTYYGGGYGHGTVFSIVL